MIKHNKRYRVKNPQDFLRKILNNKNPETSLKHFSESFSDHETEDSHQIKSPTLTDKNSEELM